MDKLTLADLRLLQFRDIPKIVSVFAFSNTFGYGSASVRSEGDYEGMCYDAL